MTNFELAIEMMIAKRTPDALSVLSDALEAGLRKGHVTANDIRNRNFAEPNIIGGTFRSCLSKCGFVCDHSRVVKAEAEQKHGRWVPIWVLEQPEKAREVLRKIRSVIMCVENDGQGLLNI